MNPTGLSPHQSTVSLLEMGSILLDMQGHYYPWWWGIHSKKADFLKNNVYLQVSSRTKGINDIFSLRWAASWWAGLSLAACDCPSLPMSVLRCLWLSLTTSMTVPHHLWLSLAACDCPSQTVTVSCHLWLSLTTLDCPSPPVTVSHHLWLSLTACDYPSLWQAKGITVCGHLVCWLLKHDGCLWKEMAFPKLS